MLELPLIYPITDRRLSGLTHAEQVRRLIDGGATLVQLREKDLGPGEWLEDAREAAAIARSSGVKLVINDRVDLALVLDADGVHLGQTDLRPEDARRLLGDDKLIGLSTHSIEQVKEARRLPVDYLGFGPIYSTATKSDHDPIVGLDALAAAVHAAGELPIVAIGGITGSSVPAVIAAGAASAAIIGDLLDRRHDIAARYRELTSIAEQVLNI